MKFTQLFLVFIFSVFSAIYANAQTVQINTNKGAIIVQLEAQYAPISVKNFLDYVKQGFYNHTIFHRVIRGFMIQGGGLTTNLEEKPPGAPIILESKNTLKNLRGTIAMARTSAPDSATSQFFINVVDNPMLDYPSPDGYGYAVFGKVIQGMEVVDLIRDVPTMRVGVYQNVPKEPIVIESIQVIK